MITGLRASALLAAVLVASAAAPSSAHTVNSTADTDDGACTAAAGGCTLREAIQALNAGGVPRIDFDPAVFPKGAPGVIAVGSGLPAITRNGSDVLGLGAAVVIDGTALVGAEHGLEMAPGAGTDLTAVKVVGLTVRGFPGDGIHLCGGASGVCADEVVKAVVAEIVADDNGGDGLRATGEAIKGVRVLDSSFSRNGGAGASLGANSEMVKATVSGCTARVNGGVGVRITSGGSNLRAAATSNVSISNGGLGIEVNAGSDLLRPTVSGNHVAFAGSDGIRINAGASQVASRVLANRVVTSASDGIELNAGTELLKPRVLGNVVLANAGAGLRLNAVDGVERAKLIGNASADNQSSGIVLRGDRNLLKRNRADANVGQGIRLDAPGERNKLGGNETRANTGSGILATAGTALHRFKRNRALGNDTEDLTDENAGCGTDVWVANSFRTANDPCIQ